MGKVELKGAHPVAGPRGVFYGWWIALAGAVAMGLSAGLNFYGFSAFFVPLAAEFGWSRAALSGVFSLSRLEGGLLGPIEGWVTDRLGPRKVMLVGVPLMGAGFILLSRVNSLPTLYLVYILGVSLGGGLGFITPATAAVANWFRRKGGRAFGFLYSGVAIGGGVMLPLITWLISSYGWRITAVVAGVLVWVVGIPIAMVMRHRPEQYGYLPDGASAPTETPAAGTPTPSQVAEREGLGWAESMRTPAFWFLSLSVSLRAVVTTGFTIHFIPMMVDRDISLTVAGALLGSVALLSLAGRLGLAWLGDILNKRYLMAGGLAVMGLTMLGVSQVHTLWALEAILVVYAIAYGGVIVLPLPLQLDYFGRRAFATIRGMIMTVQTVGMILGPVFAGFVYDVTESYFIAFMGFAVACFLSMLLILGARPPTPGVGRG